MKWSAVVLALFFVGCDRLPAPVRDLINGPAADAPVTADVICDFGGGSGRSGCTPRSLTAILREIAPTLPTGSVVRLHGMADDVASATELASYTTSAPKKKTVKAVAGHRRRQTDELVAQLVRSAAPLFDHDDRRASPIGESISRVLLQATSNKRVIYVLTDARQYSKASPALGRLDFECGPILRGEEFAQRLRALIPDRSAEGVAVHFRHATLEPVANNRCPATIERYAALQETWTTALEAQGARVTWSMN